MTVMDVVLSTACLRWRACLPSCCIEHNPWLPRVAAFQAPTEAPEDCELLSLLSHALEAMVASNEQKEQARIQVRPAGGGKEPGDLSRRLRLTDRSSPPFYFLTVCIMLMLECPLFFSAWNTPLLPG
jgi:hypothetical protein